MNQALFLSSKIRRGGCALIIDGETSGIFAVKFGSRQVPFLRNAVPEAASATAESAAEVSQSQPIDVI